VVEITESQLVAAAGVDRFHELRKLGIKKGDPGYYRIPTQWAMRLTWSGEFLHSAPWSVGSQGSANVSHGCTNLAPADAKWLFGQSSMGDVVKFVGSSRHLEEYNGYTMWNLILLRSPGLAADEDLVRHELCHVWQMQHHPIAMPLSYLWQGYRDNPNEVEARAAAEARD